MKKFLIVIILLLLILGCAHLGGDSYRPKTLSDEQLQAEWWFNFWSGFLTLSSNEAGFFYAAELKDRGYCRKPFGRWSRDCEKD